ncbi:DcrB-related protein [Myxococcota bacterium]|nr:DcrB-related protein [Myxococcota bacterium]
MELNHSQYGNVELALPPTWVDNTVVNYLGPPKEPFRPNVVVVERRIAGKPSLASFGEKQKEVIEGSQLPDFEELESGVVTVGDKRAYLYGYRWRNAPDGGDGLLLRQDLYFLIEGQISVTITFSCADTHYDEMQSVFKSIVEDTKITK